MESDYLPDLSTHLVEASIPELVTDLELQSMPLSSET